MKGLLEDYEERIDEIKKKYESTMKEKTLMKLERDKLLKKTNDLSSSIEDFETRSTRKMEIENARRTKKIKRQQLKATIGFPDDARPNPLLSRNYDDFQTNMAQGLPLEAHTASVANIAIHSRKEFLATVSDDCTWKIWNM